MKPSSDRGGLDVGDPPIAAREAVPLSPFGRARRCRAQKPDGEAVELWELEREDEPAAARVLRLGARGIGAFVAGGRGAAGVWLLRVDGGKSELTLARQLRAERGGWSAARAAGLGLDLARALAAAESERAWVGPLTTDGVVVSRGRAHVVADTWVAATFGASRDAVRPGLSAQYTPPEQADGAPWDEAANRYVLGLILYRAVSGAHAFGGAGLRHALDEARHRGAPPFDPEVARALPPGLQSAILAMIDPDPRERPASASAIEEQFVRFVEAVDPHRAEPTLVSGVAPVAPPVRARAEARRDARANDPARSPPPIRAVRGAPRRARALLAIALPVVVSVAAAAAALTQLKQAPATAAPSAKGASVGAAKPLAAGELSAQRCESCHPRQTAEWRRSVMGHAVKSPLFNALEMLVEEQVGRDRDCPNGAGILRKADPRTACRSGATNLPITGSGGEHWCVNCHSPGENLDARMPAWEGLAGGDPRTRLPPRDLLSKQAMEGVSCGFCHTAHGPGGPGRPYQGNPTWTSFLTGAVFASRPEDQAGTFGIGNSGYELAPGDFLFGRGEDPWAPRSFVAHKPTSAKADAYLASSEFCGACHDVRLFGTDAIGGKKGEHFKRLRNAYSEWVAWTEVARRKNKPVATCQGCHMSAFPGVCESGAPGDPSCPSGTGLVAKPPREYPDGFVAVGSGAPTKVTTHYLSGVDLPLSREYPEGLVDEGALDAFGIPLSARKRRDMLLRSSFRFELGRGALQRAGAGGASLTVPITIENVGAGHRVPAGFSQEREIWVHLRVTDADGRVVYEVGDLARSTDDLADKVFLRVATDPDQQLDFAGRPVGLFGADVRDGPDVPLWSPPPELGGTAFRGRGLINFQNGFLRCVQCIGILSPDGRRCDPTPDQLGSRAARFEDGAYDPDTGECASNLAPEAAFFETYFPVGALDASRGLLKAPDAIIDTRSAPPETPITYTYELDAGRARAPLTIEAELRFRAFPPYLIRAFAAYEAAAARSGKRPNGPLVDEAMLQRLDVVTIARATATVR